MTEAAAAAIQVKKKTTQYTNSILKFKLAGKKPDQYSALLEDVRKAKSATGVGIKLKGGGDEAVRQARSSGMGKEGGKDGQEVSMGSGGNSSFDRMVAGSSVDSSMCSVLDAQAGHVEATDSYSQSVMVSSMVKEPEDLIDRDLLNLLGFIKKAEDALRG